MWAKVDGNFLRLKEDRRLAASSIFHLLTYRPQLSTFVELMGAELS
ncbi:hypothetical protein KUG47_05130 [Falsochrobactrum sp. TDYN1]|uniref:Uncharacterized protein n=1 Tax=Falsochrobactrum tianjinense TaxID=2706015 RepID=A0A949PQ76_9HYPH|nr:hypothetical protein [Falsochrobactrum sp. TDYN1]MBV2142880.1 hypothetical protein [Falsochrobactrum sp. TDYN1]